MREIHWKKESSKEVDGSKNEGKRKLLNLNIRLKKEERY
jgi:hypothetical protein